MHSRTGIYDSKYGSDYSKCKWLKLYLLNMGAALQLLGTFVQGERPAIRDLDDHPKQRIMMAMDLLSWVWLGQGLVKATQGRWVFG